MLLFELFEDVEQLRFEPNVGAVHVKFAYVPEQEQAMKDAGITPPATDAYVVYAHVLDYHQHDMMDRLKSRKQYATQTPEQTQAINQMIDNAIAAVAKADTDRMSHKWETTRAAVRQLQQFIKNGSKVIVVPAPSSSALVNTIAARLASTIGAKVVAPFSKNTHPPVSVKQLQRQYPERDFTDVENPAMFKHEMEAARRYAEKAADEGNDEQFDYWEKEYSKLKKRYEQYTYKRKNYQYAYNAHVGKAFYDTIRADGNAKSLNGAYVILVDDNVMQGVTFSEAIKALWLQGIVPKQIVGFAPHKFTTVRQ